MRVATWNLWWRFGPWQQRQAAIESTLYDIDADVVLLQEVFGPGDDSDDQAARLAASLGMQWVATTGARSSFGNAILSRYPISDTDQLVLPGRDRTPSHRSALWAVLDHPDGPQPVATTHLDWRYDASSLRQTQVEALVVWLARHHRALGQQLGVGPDQHRPLVLGGDFNAVPEADEMRRLVGLSTPYGTDREVVRVFTDAWAACGDGDGYTWTRDNEHSADAQWPRRRLDYLLVSWPRPKPTGNPIACRLAGLQAVGGVLASDHACVVADFDDRPAFA